MAPRAAWLHAQLLRSTEGRLRPLWLAGYRCAALALAAWLRRGLPGTTVYARSSVGARDLAPGLSDLDLIAVAWGDPGEVEVLRARRLRLRHGLSAVDSPVDVDVVSGEAGVPATPPALYGLPAAPGAVGRAAYFGPEARPEDRILLDRVPVGGPGADWQRLAGRRRTAPWPPVVPGARRLYAWSQLQWWWARAAVACTTEPRPSDGWLCAKLVAEPLRSWLWLVHDELPASRAEVLRRAGALLDEEAPAVAGALEVLRRPATTPPPLDEAVATLHRTTARIIRAIEDDLAAAGTTPVALRGLDAEGLVLRPRATADATALGGGPVHPLVDWRALVVVTRDLDESFAAVDGHPGDARALGRAARADGTYAALVADGLMVLPSVQLAGRGLGRTLHASFSAPVCRALLEDREVARFPDVPGWSVDDTARRAVAEHLGRFLGLDPEHADDPEVLPWLLTAARAALLHETVLEGAPALTPTAAGTAEALAGRVPEARGAIEEALGCFREERLTGGPVPPAAVRGLRRAVRGLPSYRGVT